MDQQVNHNQQIDEEYHLDDLDEILYERLPANRVSWRRRDQRFTLTSDDIRIRNNILEAIHFALYRRQKVLKILIVRKILLLDDGNDEENFIILFLTVRQLFTQPIRRLISHYVDLFGVTRATHIQFYQNPPLRNRRIEEWTEDIILKEHTRFTKSELNQLKDLFFDDIDTNYVIVHGHRIYLEFALLIFVKYFCSGEDYPKLQSTFGGDTTKYTHAINFLVDHLYTKYYHKICGSSLQLYMNDVDSFRTAIYNTSFEPSLDNYPLDDHRIFGFIDTKGHESTRPGGSGAAEHDEERAEQFQLQQAFYSAYGKMHGLRVQAVTLPNGMFGHIYVSTAAQNDRGILNLSGVQEALVSEFDRVGLRIRGMWYPALGGDDIYSHSEVIISTHHGDVIRHPLKSARVRIEHHFGLVMSLWKLLMCRHKHKIKYKDQFKKRLVVAHFLTNCYTCFRGNTVATSFGLEKPNIEDYLEGPHIYHEEME